MPAHSSTPRPFRFKSRPLVFAGLAVVVAALHAAVLLDASAPARHEAAGAASSPAPLQLSLRPGPDGESAQASSPNDASRKVGRESAIVQHASLATRPKSPPARPRPQAPVIIPAEAEFVAVAASESQVAEAAAASAPEVAATYRTRIPKAFSYRYDMRRGAIGGLGELTWKPTATGYEAQMRGSVGGLAILGWISTGTFDANGLAPSRYVDHRIGKSDQAANFQRSEGKITFSGSSNEYPVEAGAQDRLSWMIQLPAILAADPAKAKAGTRLSVFVVGAHGDAEVWVFESSGSEQVSTPAGTFNANKWSREPRRPHDTMVEVWLDPTHQYLPVKARLSAPPSDSALELDLNGTGS